MVLRKTWQYLPTFQPSKQVTSVRVIDAVVDRPVYWLEGDLLRNAGGDDSP